MEKNGCGCGAESGRVGVRPPGTSADGMFSEPWRSTAVVEASRGYFAAAALVTVRSFLAVPDLSYWKGSVAARLQAASGLVGHSVHTDASGQRCCLVTLWADGPSRERFTRTVVRGSLIEELGPEVSESLFAEWELAGAETPPSLAEALGRLRASS